MSVTNELKRDMSDWFQPLKKMVPAFDIFDAVFIILLSIIIAALSMHAISLHSPIIAGDEYAYFEQGRYFPNQQFVRSLDPTIQATNNELYFWLVKRFWIVADQVVNGVKILQTSIYAISISLLYLLSRVLLSRILSFICGVTFLLSPVSAYVSYVMPETLYFLCYFLIAILFYILGQTRIGGPIATGLCTGCLLLIKPHGAAVVLALSVLWVIPWNAFSWRSLVVELRTGVQKLAIYLLSVYLWVTLVNFLLTRTINFSPLLFAGEFYTGVLNDNRPSVHLQELLLPLFSNATIAGIYLVFPIGSTVVFWSKYIRKLQESTLHGPNVVWNKDEARLQFSVFLILSATAMVCMTVLFTSHIGGQELLRIHGRYYAFFFPLSIIVILANRELFLESKYATFCTLATLVFLTFSLRYYILPHYHLNPWDFPEFYILSIADRLPVLNGWSQLILGSFLSLLFIGIARPQIICFAVLYFTLLANTGSLIVMTVWQNQSSNSWSAFDDRVRVLDNILQASKSGNGVVIANNRNTASYYLFNYFGINSVSIEADENTLQDDKWGKFDWVAVIGHFSVPSTKFSVHNIFCPQHGFEVQKLTLLIRLSSPILPDLSKNIPNFDCK